MKKTSGMSRNNPAQSAMAASSLTSPAPICFSANSPIPTARHARAAPSWLNQDTSRKCRATGTTKSSATARESQFGIRWRRKSTAAATSTSAAKAAEIRVTGIGSNRKREWVRFLASVHYTEELHHHNEGRAGDDGHGRRHGEQNAAESDFHRHRVCLFFSAHDPLESHVRRIDAQCFGDADAEFVRLPEHGRK